MIQYGIEITKAQKPKEDIDSCFFITRLGVPLLYFYIYMRFFSYFSMIPGSCRQRGA